MVGEARSRVETWLQAPFPQPYLTGVGGWLVEFARTVHGLLAFTLIILGVLVTQFNIAARVIRPLIRVQIVRAGLGLLPMITFISFGLGFVIIGQMVAILSQVKAEGYAGMAMVVVVVRELGPIVAATVVLVRVGAANVIELGTARALGEIEGLEALGIDPIHFLVVPRVLGLAISTFCLTVYLILGTLASGYLFAFLEDIPLQWGEYVNQLVTALQWHDFVLVTLKTCAFGSMVAIITCYEGLAKPLRVEEIARATTHAVVDCVIGWVLLDALFIFVYLWS